MAEIPIETWDGCYDDSWDTFIVPEAFAHPAKYARGLITRIFENMLAEGMLAKGNTVVDPFGGIATGGIVAAGLGIKWFGCELEEKFWNLGNQNIEMHRKLWEQFGDPVPVLVQGDSRKLRENLHGVLADACVSSPPFAESLPNSKERSGLVYGNARYGHKDRVTDMTPHDYGQTPGQLGAMKPGDVADALVSSPPYNLPMSQDHNGTRGGARGTEPSEGGAFVKYGSTPGQLEGLPMGDVAAVVSSPPYAETAVAKNSSGIDRRKQWETYRSQGGGMGYEAFAAQQERHSGDYGSSAGQLSTLAAGSVDSVVTSPPYSSGTVHDGNSIDPAKLAGNKPGRNSQAFTMDEYGRTDGNLGNMPSGEVDAVISSPPYAESLRGDNSERETAENSRAKRVTEGGSLGQSCRHSGYGGPGNLGNLPAGELDACVTSPPFQGSQQVDNREKPASAMSSTWRKRQGQITDGEHPDQLGNANEETFWSAARDIVAECFAILKPGGYAAFVVKAFVRNKQIVDFPGDWRKLCEACGFECVKEVRAMLVKEQRHPDLFGGEDHVKTTERKSFFRRLYEKKYPENSINYEVVLFFRKPL